MGSYLNSSSIAVYNIHLEDSLIMQESVIEFMTYGRDNETCFTWILLCLCNVIP